MPDEQSARHGLRPIGSLIARTAITPQPEDTTADGSASRPTHSAITTLPRRQPPPTGMPRGEPGCVMPSNSRNGTALALRDRPGRDVVALLPSSVKSCLIGEAVDRYGDYGWEGCDVGGYSLRAAPPEGDVEAAVAIVIEALQPCPRELALAELTRLRSLTISRAGSDADLKLALAAYTEECAVYPADAVVAVCRSWANTERWWPSWAELRERLERIVAPRRKLSEALRTGYREPETSPDWIAPTDEEKARVDALLAENGIVVTPAGRVRRIEQLTPMTDRDRARVTAETRSFRLPDPDEPGVRSRLRDMGETA